MQNIHQCFFQWLQEFYEQYNLKKRSKPFYCNLHNGLSVYHVNKITHKALNLDLDLLTIAIFDNIKGKKVVEYFSMSNFIDYEELRLQILDELVLDWQNQHYHSNAKQFINQLQEYLTKK